MCHTRVEVSYIPKSESHVPHTGTKGKMNHWGNGDQNRYTPVHFKIFAKSMFSKILPQYYVNKELAMLYIKLTFK